MLHCNAASSFNEETPHKHTMLYFIEVLTSRSCTGKYFQSCFYSLCVCLKENECLEDIVREIVADYDISPYEDNFISEEEFVYDCLHHAQLNTLLQNSLKSFNIELKFDGILSSDESD